MESKPKNNWPDPTPEMLEEPLFNAIWSVIKSWDVNVPSAYQGYCGATGNHVRAIYDAIQSVPSFTELTRLRGIEEAARELVKKSETILKQPILDAIYKRHRDEFSEAITKTSAALSRVK